MSFKEARLEAFSKIVKLGTVHAAASALGLTQTAVTQRLRSLETSLGVSLFTRSRTGMRLTEEGSALHRYCQQVEDLDGRLLSELKGRELSTARLTIAGPTSLTTARLVPVLAPVYKEFPRLQLNFQIDDHANRVDLLKKGAAQLVVIPPSEVRNEFDSKLLKPDRYVLVATPKWRGRKLGDILANERMIDFYENDETTKRYLAHFGLKSKGERLFANSNEALRTLVREGVGYATMTLESATDDMLILNGKQSYEDLQALAWYPREPMPPYMKRVISLIR